MNDEIEFMARLKLDFLVEAQDLIDHCEEVFLGLEDAEGREAKLAHIFRVVHTIKGSGAAVGFVDLVEFAHQVENCLAALRTYPEKLTFELTSLLLSCLDALRSKVQSLSAGSEEKTPTECLEVRLTEAMASLVEVPATRAERAFGFFEEESGQSATGIAANEEHTPGNKASPSEERTTAPRKDVQSVKVDPDRIDTVLDLVGELVVIKSQLVNQTEAYRHDVPLAAVVSLLDKTVRELQDRALEIRMMPIKPLFLKMQRMARDLAIRVEKSVHFDLGGEETELDRMVVESLADPLLHLVRNAIDHGIECPDTRRAQGKDPQGHLRISAATLGGRVIVSIRDDGRGIHREKVVQKAIERGVLRAGTRIKDLSDPEIYALLLAPGFSTADKVTDLSGRGVGLDVVKTQIEKLKGSLNIRSEEGRGTLFEISLPLTASVTDGMIVNIAGQTLVLPMDRIRELVSVEAEHIVEVGPGQQMLNVRGRMMPLLDSVRLFTKGHRSEAPSHGLAVVFDHHDRLYALSISSVIGQMQVIIKPMCRGMAHELVSGVTILGDGQVALMADVDGVVDAHLREQSADQVGIAA